MKILVIAHYEAESVIIVPDDHGDEPTDQSKQYMYELGNKTLENVTPVRVYTTYFKEAGVHETLTQTTAEGTDFSTEEWYDLTAKEELCR